MINSEKETEYYDITLTDITLHTNPVRNPKPWYIKVIEAFKVNKTGRFYFNNAISISTSGNPTLSLPLISHLPEIQREKAKAEALGKKFRIFVPKVGLPIIAGKDTIEKVRQLKEKERRIVIHNNRDNVWREE